MDIRKRGRPKKNGAKIVPCMIRLTEADAEKLNYIVGKTGKTRSSIIREGIQMRYNIALYRD